MDYKESVQIARNLGFRLDRQACSSLCDVRDKEGRWLCFDHELPDYLKNNNLIPPVEGGEPNAKP